MDRYLSEFSLNGDILDLMKRVTVSLPDDLAKGLDRYLSSQESPLTLPTVLQAALRLYLAERGFLRTGRTLVISAASTGSGRSDISQRHDCYLRGT